MKALGICVGASTISMAGLERNESGGISTLDVRVEPHHGIPRRYLLEMLNGIDADRYDRVSVTGRRFRQFLNLSSIPEPQAVEQALAHLNGRGDNLEAVVSAGGETFLVYALGRDGRISTVHTGNKCASGTGEFFLQQIKRLGMDVGEATAACPFGEPLPRLGPLQRLLQERLHPCGQQGCAEGEDRGGTLPDDGGKDRRDPPPGAPPRHHGHRRHGAKRRRHGSPAPGDQEPPGPRRGTLLRGPGRRALGSRKRDGAFPWRRKAFPRRGEFLHVSFSPWRTFATGWSSSPRGGAKRGQGSG